MRITIVQATDAKT